VSKLTKNTNYGNLSKFALPPVEIGDTIISYSTKVKNLGVIMNCNLTWNDQISSTVSSVNGTLSRLWCTAHFTQVETRRRLVVALLVPKFQYCDILYSQSSMGNRDRLNKCYNSCARYVYNIRSSESISGPGPSYSNWYDSRRRGTYVTNCSLASLSERVF
jgi:hypothetical protein